MNTIDMLGVQTQSAYHWVNKLADSIPFEQWDTLPDGIASNVSWQIGHLVVSFYYHTVMVIKGHQPYILKAIPMKQYDTFYTSGSPFDSAEQVSPAILKADLIKMENWSLEVINSLTSADLNTPLEAAIPAHPVARNKFEAIDWNIKHTMWHCGQLGMIKRQINGRYDFRATL